MLQGLFAKMAVSLQLQCCNVCRETMNDEQTGTASYTCPGTKTNTCSPVSQSMQRLGTESEASFKTIMSSEKHAVKVALNGVYATPESSHPHKELEETFSRGDTVRCSGFMELNMELVHVTRERDALAEILKRECEQLRRQEIDMKENYNTRLRNFHQNLKSLNSALYERDKKLQLIEEELEIAKEDLQKSHAQKAELEQAMAVREREIETTVTQQFERQLCGMQRAVQNARREQTKAGMHTE